MELYQFARFALLWLFVSETISLCCHLPYMQSLPCEFKLKTASELKLLVPTDEGREVGMPSSMDFIFDWIQGLCPFALCAPGYIQESGKVFCSTGSCNFFGCNCDGECINGEHIDERMQRLRLESNNTDLIYEHLSRARRSAKSNRRNKPPSVPDSPTSTSSHSQPIHHDPYPPGTTIGYDPKFKHLFDYNGNFKVPRNFMEDKKRFRRITGNLLTDLSINFISSLAVEVVSKKWLFPEPNQVNNTALTSILKEYNATINEIVMQFKQPFDQLNSTMQDAFVHKGQFMNLIDYTGGNATEAISTLRNSIYNA